MQRKIEKVLHAWKNCIEGRMPLLLYGAQQVGKTYILNEFGEKNYKNTVYVNLETNLAVARYFSDDISPERLIRFLEATANDVIIPGDTLIILDEIQSCERALTSMKYFCENAPQYHVAAAGSLHRNINRLIPYGFLRKTSDRMEQFVPCPITPHFVSECLN